jgi:hypothetical protein
MFYQKIHEARTFNFTYRYIDDVLSINNSRFAEFLPLIYPPELQVKETTNTASSVSFLDLYLEFDTESESYLQTSDFILRTSHFEAQTSDFGIVISGFSPSLVLAFSHQTDLDFHTNI